jgi:glycosyltransferase involved in cell wall biosynthesis
MQFAMTKIKYITNVRIPTPRAQGYAIMKMCSEFAKAGAEVKLFVPERGNNQFKKDPFDFYKIEKNFEIKKIPSFDFLGGAKTTGPIFYWIDILSFFIMSKFMVRLNAGDVLYTRDFITTLFFSKKHFICLELHDIPTSKFLFRLAIKRPKLFFVLNSYIKGELIKFGVPENIIHIAPSGVDIKDFDIFISKEEARKKIDLPLDKDIVMYTGHLYTWKGADTLAKAAVIIPDTLFVFVGGIEPELSQFIDRYKKYENIIVHPFVERSMIPIYLKSSDLLVLPNSANERVSSQFTSPLKLFEYMASEQPIVASNLPSIREVLNEYSCVFAEADDPESFAQAIKKLLSDSSMAERITEAAFKKVAKYSWQDRAKNILSVINR